MIKDEYQPGVAERQEKKKKEAPPVRRGATNIG